MAWFQRDATDPRVSSSIHDGVGEIVRRRLFADRLSLPVHAQVWELAPGTSEGDHTHPGDDPDDSFEELYYVLSGTGVITIGGARHEIAPDDAVLVPTGVDHGLYATGSEPLRILLVFGKPPRG